MTAQPSRRREPVPPGDRARWLASVLVELAGTMVEDFDLVEMLTTVGERCAELLGEPDVGVIVVDDSGQHRQLAASPEGSPLVELAQHQDRDGPCGVVHSSGNAIVNAEVTDERWPSFGVQAQRHDYEIVHAFPLRYHGEVVGGLCVLDREQVVISDDTAGILQALADLAGIALMHHRAAERASRQAEQLQLALRSRVAIEQAKGILAERLHLDVDDVFGLMRAYARNRNEKLSDVAAAVVAGSLHPGAIAAHRSDTER